MLYSKEVYFLYSKIALKAYDLNYGSLKECFLNFTPLLTRIAHTSSKEPDLQLEKLLSDINSQNSLDCNETTDTIYNFFGSIQEPDFPKEPMDLIGVFYTVYYPKFKNLGIHFYLPDRLKSSPFSIQHLDQRKAEIKQLFEKAKLKYPDAERVRGFSWLHNMDFYKRIFPDFYYTKGSVAVKDYYSSNAYWGQFVNRDGSCRLEPSSKFINCIDLKEDASSLADCFPLKGLEVICDINYFYDYYGI